MSSRHIGHKELIAQIKHIITDHQVIAAQDSIRKVIVSNNGSVLDQETFPVTALMFLVEKLKLHFPGLSVLSIETRPEYVDAATLDSIRRVLTKGHMPTHLEIAVGFEVFDDYIRNDVFGKGLTLKTFEQLAEKIARYGCRLKCYFMQKPIPAMTDEDAIVDIRQAIDYLDHIA
ncbi:hypothetical protein VU05_05635, partial [Desulfobulbus sp. F1]|nr:hypothetical protein [Desulfobulbus sp. F1]